jgi:hypothetical protein
MEVRIHRVERVVNERFQVPGGRRSGGGRGE